MQSLVPLIGRVLIAAIFLISGYGKIMDPQGAMQYMSSAGMPAVRLFLIGAIILEIGGGLCLITGFHARRGALALIVFLVPTTLIFHTNFSDRMQVIMFLKNLAILGGLLMAAAYGAGTWSLDARRKSGP